MRYVTYFHILHINRSLHQCIDVEVWENCVSHKNVLNDVHEWVTWGSCTDSWRPMCTAYVYIIHMYIFIHMQCTWAITTCAHVHCTMCPYAKGPCALHVYIYIYTYAVHMGLFTWAHGVFKVYCMCVYIYIRNVHWQTNESRLTYERVMWGSWTNSKRPIDPWLIKVAMSHDTYMNVSHYI